MDTAVLITLIIVAGIVLIAVTGIAWLWWVTAKGVMAIPGARGTRDLSERVTELEQEVAQLRNEVDRIRNR